MTSIGPRQFVNAALAVATLALAAAGAGAQGTLTGTATAVGIGTPLQEARVMIVGTSLVTTTGPDGKYTLRRVPAGTAEVRVIRVGYAEQKKAVMIADGQNGDARLRDGHERRAASGSRDHRHRRTAPRRDWQRRREPLGVVKLTATEPIRNIGDVLNSRVPGVMVQKAAARPVPASASASAA